MATSKPPENSCLTPDRHRLAYTIHKCSSSSSTYLPENILIDKPKDQSSRWSSEANTPPQYLILKLEKPSVVTHITFGKYEKTHVCNLKRFKVFGIAATSESSHQHEDGSGSNSHPQDFELPMSGVVGVGQNAAIELIDSGLKNDSVPETFRLKHTVNGHLMPCRYIKIVPIQSWGPSFNFSIWYVAIEGDNSDGIVNPALAWHDKFRETEAIRLCLKHFRQQNYIEAFESLQKRTRIQLEDPLLTELHTCLVRQGDYGRTEEIITRAIEDGLFDDWIGGQQPVPCWNALILPDEYLSEELSPASPSQTPIATPGNLSPEAEHAVVLRGPVAEINIADGARPPPPPLPLPAVGAQPPTGGEESSPSSSNAVALPVQPGCRGGHQMVIDSGNQMLYLFGGWDGNRDLNDFWSFHIPTSKWRLLSMDTEADGGPSPRSCHKMVLDIGCRHIFILGRYLERSLRVRVQNIKSDFFMYDIGTNKWTLITDDTSAMGGPSLIFDHQMCIDQETRTIYVFGGQSLFQSYTEGSSSSSSEKSYSGLYDYHIPTNTWKKRRDDIGSGGSPSTELRSRSSHSMLFHQGMRKLFIFGGQRNRDDYLNDFFCYNVDTDEVDIISTGSCAESAIPAVGHTQRATIDCERSDIHVMTGLNKDKNKSDKRNESKVSNSFWVYNIVNNKWTCFYRNENNSSIYWNKMQSQEPRPRYAHQLVYDETSRLHYMFGGNPGGKQGKEDRLRLGDFWCLQLSRPDRKEILRRCLVYIRRNRFSELAENPMSALNYLHTCLAAVVDHKNPKEEREYQLLTTELFKPPSRSSCSGSGKSREASPEKASKTYNLRSDLFDKLALHFPEKMTHPRGNLIDLIPYSSEL